MARGFAASKTKKEFLERLGLVEGQPQSEDVFRKMLDEATLGRQRVSQDTQNLMPQLRNDSNLRPPYTYNQITETARHREVLYIYQHASDMTRPLYDQGHYFDGANEENWVVRWCLYHSFRYTDNRNRNRTRGRKTSSNSPPQSVHSPHSGDLIAADASPVEESVGELLPSSQRTPRKTVEAPQSGQPVRTDYYDPARDL